MHQPSPTGKMMTQLIAFASLWEAQNTLDALDAQPLVDGHLYSFSAGKIVITGKGVVAAAVAVAKHADDVDAIWNIGVTGALHPEYSLGTVMPIQHVSKHLSLPSHLDSHSEDVAAKTSPPLTLPQEGRRLISSDYPIHDAALRQSLAQHADVVDMEGYGVVAAAQYAGKPCMLRKVVSDFCQSQGWQVIHQQKNTLSAQMADIVVHAMIST